MLKYLMVKYRDYIYWEDYMTEYQEDKWIGIEEAASYLSVNKDTIRNWIKKDTGIPAHKIGKLWKFKKSELDEWIKSGKSAITN